MNIKDQVAKLSDGLKNPYFNLYHWCKGELFDIEAIYNAINVKDRVFEKINKKEKEVIIILSLMKKIYLKMIWLMN